VPAAPASACAALADHGSRDSHNHALPRPSRQDATRVAASSPPVRNRCGIRSLRSAESALAKHGAEPRVGADESLPRNEGVSGSNPLVGFGASRSFPGFLAARSASANVHRASTIRSERRAGPTCSSTDLSDRCSCSPRSSSALILEGADVGEAWESIAAVLNWAIWLAFLGGLVAMLVVVRDRRRYLLHNPLNVAIVVLTPPVLPALFQGLRAVRVLRLACLLRLAPIFRLAFSLRGLRYASVFTLLVVLTGAASFESAEPGKDYFDGVYWAISTMTTVGYGDERPTTVEAKILAMALMPVGIGYFAVVTGANR
jgi:voltage-gated potassium channel